MKNKIKNSAKRVTFNPNDLTKFTNWKGKTTPSLRLLRVRYVGFDGKLVLCDCTVGYRKGQDSNLILGLSKELFGVLSRKINFKLIQHKQSFEGQYQNGK